jgi:undecaprenyl phosphate N,N'-diacetylbacillosamine 1-phosphate transferase
MGIKMFKSIFDKILALFLIILFSPIYIVVSLLIFFKMGSPILFRQKRPGYKEKIFGIYKFRTMTNEKDANGNLLPDDKRLVGIGKFIRSTSLDELPQLFNVLKGEMSFVGPRPLLEEYLPLYNEKQKRRHDVKPGITGWAQVNGRNAISWEQKFDYDVWYVDNQSFLLDIKILWMTFLKVVKRSDISSTNHATMEKFEGSKK